MLVASFDSFEPATPSPSDASDVVLSCMASRSFWSVAAASSVPAPSTAGCSVSSVSVFFASDAGAARLAVEVVVVVAAVVARTVPLRAKDEMVDVVTALVVE